MDMEKVIKGLEHCKQYGSLGGNDCNGHYEYTDNLQDIIKANNHRKDCPYGQCRTWCVVTLVADALTLLEEQESIIESLKSDVHETLEVVSRRLNVVRCKDCRQLGETNNHWYCKWLNRCVDEDFFCADGVKRDE